MICLSEIERALKRARRPLRRSEIAAALMTSKSVIIPEVESLVQDGIVVRETYQEHGVRTYYYRLDSNPWQVKRGRYVSVLCPCGWRVILARVRLAGFEGWYSMICKGCRTMRYLNESELEN